MGLISDAAFNFTYMIPRRDWEHMPKKDHEGFIAFMILQINAAEDMGWSFEPDVIIGLEYV